MSAKKVSGFTHVLLVVIVFVLGGCMGTKPTVKKSHTPPSVTTTQPPKTNAKSYDINRCLLELKKGSELDETQRIDKLVAYKSKRMLYGYRDGKVVLQTRMSLGKNGDKGDKIQAGDYRTPEGDYKIIRKKCDPRLYRSLMIDYPNAQDRAEARARGVNPGGYITIHGQPVWNADGHGDDYTLSKDWTEGCMAVPNRVMDRLWKGVKYGTPIKIYP